MRIKYILLFAVPFLLGDVYSATVIGTTEITFADTIVAKVVSEIYGYPIVIFDRGVLTNDVLEELQEYNATDIIIIGGPAVISPQVEEELKQLGYNVIRIWGVTREETSSLVAKFFWDEANESVIITRELTSEGARIDDLKLTRDAINLAIAKGIPLMITPRGELDPSVEEALVDLGVDHVYVFTINNETEIQSLLDRLSYLNITYEVFSAYKPIKPVCENVIRVGVPENRNWTELKEVLFGLKCLEIVPVRDNITLQDLQALNISLVLVDQTSIETFKNMVKQEFKRKLEEQVVKPDILMSRLDKMLADLKLEIEFWKTIDNETARDLEEYYIEAMQYIKQNRFREAFETVLDGLEESREMKWERNMWMEEKRFRGELSKKLKEVYLEVSREYYGDDLLEELEIEIEARKGMPDIAELRKRVMEMNRFGNRTFCIQVVTYACNPTDLTCKEFPTPCDVPKGWLIVKDIEDILEIKKELRKRKGLDEEEEFYKEIMKQNRNANQVREENRNEERIRNMRGKQVIDDEYIDIDVEEDVTIVNATLLDIE